MPDLLRFFHPDTGNRLGCLIDETVYDVTPQYRSLAEWLKSSVGHVAQAIDGLVDYAKHASSRYPLTVFEPVPSPHALHLLAPVDEQEVWAAGVTYEHSRSARQEEAQDGGDIYARVFNAGRPELFYKAAGRQVVGPGDRVGIRHDATWSVPEPELVVVFNPAIQAVGFTVGNDMSSRDIEGANPLYLPQAKIYTASCALGPAITLQPAQDWPITTIRISIIRAGETAFNGQVDSSRIRRPLTELGEYLGRCIQFPNGVVLLTGTGIVPPKDFTLQEGDVVSISIDGIGTLTNTVRVV